MSEPKDAPDEFETLNRYSQSETFSEYDDLEPLPGHVSEQFVQRQPGRLPLLRRQTHLYNAVQEELRQLVSIRQAMTKRISREFALFEAGQARA